MAGLVMNNNEDFSGITFEDGDLSGSKVNPLDILRIEKKLDELGELVDLSFKNVLIMENSVIIVIVLALLCAWIAWLVYNYKVITRDITINEKIKYYTNRYNNLQDCMNDLIEAIHQKFPNSTVQYIHNNEGVEAVEGEIKY